jgi:MerR family mercuric resistance operon transcriptional regulator
MDTSSPRLAIGILSKRTGSRVETIRYYEHVGLLPRPPRSPGGYRLYGIEHLKRLAFIRRARALGFSIAEVRKLLRLADERPRPCAEARVIAAGHLEAVRTKIADLRTMQRVLVETIARCESGVGAHCPLIEALYRDASAAGPNGADRREPGAAKRAVRRRR